MTEYAFTAQIISGHRITIRNDIVDDLNLKDGDKLRVTVRRMKERMPEHAVVTQARR